MELIEAISGRRSIRKYKDKHISEDVIKKIIEVGTMAPSACNQQRYSFIIIKDENLKKKLNDQAKAWQVVQAPVAIYVLCDKNYNDGRLANLVGVAASIQNMCLFAHSIGIGSLMLGGYGIDTIVKRLLKIPKNQRIVCALCLGYPDEEPLLPSRRAVNEFIHNNFFKQQHSTVNPEYWRWRDLATFWETSTFAKSPEIGYKPFFKHEYNTLISFISNQLSDHNLLIYDNSGVYSFELAIKNPKKVFTSLVPSTEIMGWLEKRKQHLNITNITFTNNINKIQLFSCILCLDIFNQIPSQERNRITKLISSISADKSKVIVSFINKYSIYGLYIKNGIGRRFGPEKSLSINQVLGHMSKHQFIKQQMIGINLIPSLDLLLSLGLPQKYNVFKDLLKLWSKVVFFERIKFKLLLKYFCIKNIIIFHKKSNNILN